MKTVTHSIPTVGQTLHMLYTGNETRRRSPQIELIPMVVTNVGRKYFKCASPEDIKTGREEYSKREYLIENWTENGKGYCSNSRLYSDPQEWEDEKESAKICKELGKYFEYGRNVFNIRLDYLWTIKRILEEATQNKQQ